MTCRAVSSQSNTDAREVGPVDGTHGLRSLAPLQSRISLHRVVYRSCTHFSPNLTGLALIGAKHSFLFVASGATVGRTQGGCHTLGVGGVILCRFQHFRMAIIRFKSFRSVKMF